MKLVVIDRADSWHVSDLQRAGGRQHVIVACEYNSATAIVGRPGQASRFFIGGMELASIDGILTRAMPASSLQQVVFRMDWLDQVQRQTNSVVINSAKTVEASVDKYLSLERIRAAGVNVPVTLVSQNQHEAVRHFHELENDSVVKPLFGSGGHRISRIRDLGSAKNRFAIAAANEDVIYQQQYIEHGEHDFRLLTIGEKVIGMRRILRGDWITNASRGAICEPHEPDELERTIALKSAAAVNALVSGVDLVYDSSGVPFVVEINSCPAWRSISAASGLDIARLILELFESEAERIREPSIKHLA